MRYCLLLLMLCLSACAGTATLEARAGVELRLPPAALGRDLMLQQRLTFLIGGDQRSLDALLEADATHIALAVDAAGQNALRLQWDGDRLQQQRASWLPASLRGERVLSDLQLALWPAEGIRAALPAGWSLSEGQGVRELRQGAETVQTVRYVSPQRTEIETLREGMRLIVESQEMSP